MSRLVRLLRGIVPFVLGILLGYGALEIWPTVLAAGLVPNLFLTAPGGGAVSGTVTMAAAADADGLLDVQFQVNGLNVGGPITSGACTLDWNTTSVPDGQYQLSVVGWDTTGSVTTSAPVTVSVENAPPQISGIAASGVTVSAAGISWQTNQPADSQVEFGLTTAYGNSTAINSSGVMSHAQTLSTLSPSTAYHFRVRSRNAVGALTVSADSIFTTPAAGTSGPRLNVALASNGGSAVTSSSYSSAYAGSSVINGDRKGLSWGNGGGWNDATADSYPDWVEVDFNGSKTLDEIDVFTLQDAYSTPSDPTPTMTFSSYGLRDFEVQYWTGSAWTAVPSGTVTGNNLVWRQFLVSAVTTSKIRVYVTQGRMSFSRLTEVEAYGTAASAPVTSSGPRLNVALASNGGAAVTSSSYSSAYSGSSVINGDRKGLGWGNGGGWNDATPDSYPDWVEVDFNGSKTLDEIDVFTIQDAYSTPSDPTPTMTFGSYGLRDFEVQYWTGSAWVAIPGGTVTSNNLVWRQFLVSAITTSKIRVYVTRGNLSFSRLTEIEAYGTAASAPVTSSGPRLNMALASNGGAAVASSNYGMGYLGSSLINGDRKGLNWGNGGGWNDATPDSYPDWVEVDFNGTKTLDEIDVFTVQDAYNTPSDPTPTMAFSFYGLRDFEVQYWTGSAWAAIPGGTVTSNNLVWRQFLVSAITTSKIRVYVTRGNLSFSRLTEIEAYGTAASAPVTSSGPRLNMALASNGAAAVASSSYSMGYLGSSAINGDRKGLSWGNGGGWNDATPDSYPDWLEVDFNGLKTLDEIDVFTVQDAVNAPSDPTPTMTFNFYGLRDFEVQYWTGSAWAAVPGATVTGNNLVWRQFLVSAITTTKIRVYVTQGRLSFSRITEIEAYGTDSNTGSPDPANVPASETIDAQLGPVDGAVEEATRGF